MQEEHTHTATQDENEKRIRDRQHKAEIQGSHNLPIVVVLGNIPASNIYMIYWLIIKTNGNPRRRQSSPPLRFYNRNPNAHDTHSHYTFMSVDCRMQCVLGTSAGARARVINKRYTNR